MCSQVHTQVHTFGPVYLLFQLDQLITANFKSVGLDAQHGTSACTAQLGARELADCFIGMKVTFDSLAY